MYRLNTEGQLTSGEWCTNVQQGQSVNVQWCANGATDGPWSYKEETKQVIKTSLQVYVEDWQLEATIWDKDSQHEIAESLVL